MVDGDKAGAREMRRDGGQATPDGKPLETLAAMQVMGASDQHPAVEKKQSTWPNEKPDPGSSFVV